MLRFYKIHKNRVRNFQSNCIIIDFNALLLVSGIVVRHSLTDNQCNGKVFISGSGFDAQLLHLITITIQDIGSKYLLEWNEPAVTEWRYTM